MEIYNHSWEQSSSSSSSPPPLGEEVIILASSNPKKRAGRKKFKETRHPVYRGVRRRNNNRWVCEVRASSNNKTSSRIWLGSYPTAEMAARAHDVAALALKGKMACLNFADSARGLHVPASGDIRDIQRAAAEAAEEFRPKRKSEVIEEKTQVGYVDEEATFYMPKLLIYMAEGMLMPPPHHTMYEGFGWDEMECESEVSLWSYSI